MLRKKLEKLRRFARWRFASSARIPLWWHIGQPNFGDDINPELFGRLTGQSFRFASDRNLPHLLGMGSILEKARPASVVCGSGFLFTPQGAAAPGCRVVAVRGELTRRVLQGGDDVLLGDPAILIADMLDGPVEKRHRFGFVPHVSSFREWKSRAAGNHKVIDPAADPWRVVREIASCETVLSQSLHGLIVADSLGVPNVWIAPGERMAGGRFKFDDYFTTLDAAKELVPDTGELFRTPSVYQPGLGVYRFSKAAYRAALTSAASELSENAEHRR